ncbi:MAG: hypothetical protein HKN91_13540 [Acidimicrobiia bacterium]|nr:hypothetical protein [Acidimicrobiia bacterium]
MARKDRKPRARGWYVKSGDPDGTERFWDGDKWGPQPRVMRGAEQPKPAKALDTADGTSEEEPGSQATSVALPQSSLWARISARSADMVIVILPWYFIWIRAFTTEETIVDGVATEFTVVDQTYIWAAVAFLFLYEVMFVRLWGATPGKRLVGLSVVDRETMTHPGWMRAVVRATPMVLMAAAVLAPLLWIMNVLAMWRDKAQRSLFDFSGGTVVVMDPNRPGRLAKPRKPKAE